MSDRTLTIILASLIGTTLAAIGSVLIINRYGAATVGTCIFIAVVAAFALRYRRNMSGAYVAWRARVLARRQQMEADRAAQERRVVQDALNQRIHKLQQRAAPHLMLGLHPVEFEQFVLEYFRLSGFDAQETKVTGDGGVDGVLRRNGHLFLIQCKRYAGHSVGEPPIRDLLGAVTKAQAAGGIFVTTSEFTPTAVTFATGTSIELIDGETLATRIKAFSITDPAARPPVLLRKPPIVEAGRDADVPSLSEP